MENHIDWILLVSGLATCSLFLQFLSPKRALRAFNGLNIDDDFSLFFARAFGLAVSSIGLLIIWARFEPSLRFPILSIAVVGKCLFVATVLKYWNLLGKGFALTVAFDSLCVILYSAYLLDF